MDKYQERMNKVYEIAKKVLNGDGRHGGHSHWRFTEESIPQECEDGDGYAICKIQYDEDGEYSDEVNGIAAIAAKDCNGTDYFYIEALCDDPERMRFDASDIEIAAMIGRCAQVTEDFLGACGHAWGTFR